MLETLAALGILAGQQEPVYVAPREEITVVPEAVSRLAVDEQQIARDLYLPYD